MSVLRALFSRAVFAVLLCVFAVPVLAAEDATLALFTRGDFDGAIAQGEKEHTGASLATAARAAISQAVLHDTPCLECLKRADAIATRATAADPNDPDAYIYLAAILGHETRIVGLVRARLDNIPARAKEAIDKTASLGPKNPWVLSAQGAWNIEVVATGGSFLGGVMFHASAEEGKLRFGEAIAVEPNNLIVPYEFALCLSAYDYDGEHDKIRALLSAAIADKPNDAYETALHARAETLRTLMAKGDRRGFLDAVACFQGYPS